MVMISKEDGTFVLSPSDLTSSASCEFGWMRGVDVKLGRIDRGDVTRDAMLERTSTLGLAHEARELQRLIDRHRSGVVQMPDLRPYNRDTLAAAHAQTIEHLRDGVDVVFQAAFFDGGFGGLADFIVKDDEGRYEVHDTKLARHAKVSALLQIAAYAHQLDLESIPRSPVGKLVLGDGTVFEQDLTEIIPVYLERRAKLERMLAEHIAEVGSVEWNDPRYSFCGSCDACAAEVEEHHDLLLVAGMRKTQRAKLRTAGIETIHQLAESTSPVDGMNPTTLGALRDQAAMQIAPPQTVAGREVPASSVIGDSRAIRRLPAPSPADVFFDFEGDPLWSDATATATDWGLEYLFGVIEPVGSGEFTAWWAHDRQQERAALVAFLEWVAARRAASPDMHVYHYAPYEVTALKRLVGRHGTHEDVLDDMLRGGVFVDLYQTVRQGIRAGTRSYSIKKLEPLYMGDELRTGLDNAADSIVEYQKYTDQLLDDPAAAAETLRGIADYNRYDCLSTWLLRDWLLEQIDDDGQSDGPPAPAPDDSLSSDVEVDSIDEISPVMDALLAQAGELGSRTPDEQAAAMLAAAVGYHRREHKPFWWAFYDRLTSWPGEWPEPRDCFHASRVEVVGEWEQVGRKALSRTLRLVGRLETASNLTTGTGVKGIYDDIPEGFTAPEDGGRCVGGGAVIEEVDTTTDGLDVLIVRERVPKGFEAWNELPIGLCVPSPIGTAGIEDTILDLARRVAGELPVWPTSAGLDVLRRVPPRLTTGDLGSAEATEDAIRDAVLTLDHSYLAVQGPPGTGKTYVGSRVITHLVEAGWRVGVVAQSHAVVENFFRGAIDAGLSPTLMAKPRSPQGSAWSDFNGDKLLAFIESHSDGCLVGGTAWTFSSRKAVGYEQLDLIVVDEAGQFSLANTLAVSTAAQRMLLLGDPQQLPQVSQGTHPEPVDVSALEWIADGHETMPPDRGFFLERTWRMHSALTAPVSRLAYGGRLHSEVPVTDARELSDVEPGVHTIAIDHIGNDVQSTEEATAVVDLVRSLQSRTWKSSADAEPIVMTPGDVLVVAPYNAQGALLRRELAAAGFGDTRVGTVDKFQGQEAPVVIVSMTASGADDVPRGMEFLLNRNRLNVAVSRGQWAAYIVRSSQLTDFLPTSPIGLEELGSFIQVAMRDDDLPCSAIDSTSSATTYTKDGDHDQPSR
ncbi:TM0106 family RecB-like putative nuclease [Aeromicrobium sp. CFBP 8757]|uniref:TM0106 family RecB-like putative nuclease n=1 Tax=Aeromicrobium sp. CFBP 8757 TaxID=2775288 RepID=UPI0017807DFE|nr:bifunctional RecB family nuclease/DEAD/DEAH box helicase [Aeromicrobium sp. CFBP 8757]MBD8606025.1 TM0106 family RecB-like putative nuclease [Aeromicrobium sp. CFBP 8757]